MQNHDDDHRSPKRKSKYRRGQAPGSKEHQFESGQSGNRRGRPKDKKATKSNPPSSTDALLTEGNRLVTLNDTGETLTVLQLMLRAETTSGVKGNAFALRHSIDRMVAANKERTEAVIKIYRWAVERKEAYAEQRRRCVGQKTTQCEAFPHPDNIVLNPIDSGLWQFGGLTQEQAVARASMRQHLKLLERILTECTADLERRTDDQTKRDEVAFFTRWRNQAAWIVQAGDEPIYVGLSQEDPISPPTRPMTDALRAYEKELMLRYPVAAVLEKSPEYWKAICNA